MRRTPFFVSNGLEYLPGSDHPVRSAARFGAGYLKLGSLMRFVSRSVVTGLCERAGDSDLLWRSYPRIGPNDLAC